ncbi:MAG TPA: PP2C family protein-serine/threonine phosphatase [Candidatus Eisenbacteria bacterium]|nr:PP2C family protein-serine/threonine phosphatase [Candidatus Eisenbacteria bacterium]
MASRSAAWTWIVRLVLRPLLLSVPFALFFHTLFGDEWSDLPDFYVAALVFSLSISAMIEVNRAWIAPRLVPPDRDRPGHPLEIASFAVAAMLGSVIAAVLLQFTIAPGMFGSGRQILTVLLFGVVFTGLFLGVIYAVQMQRLVIQRARETAREERELELAAEVQKALLPPKTRSGPTYRAAGASLACRTIGGDFFETFDLPDGRLGFALGDVAGKGPSAAILAGLTQGVFTSHVGDGDGPATTLTRVNRAICRRAVESRFATIAYLILAPDGTLRASSAGHLPVFVARTDGSTLWLSKGGLLAGAFEDATYEEDEIALRPGDTVVVYSDGLTDAENPAGEQFGDDRLRAALQDASRLDSPETALDTVLLDVQRFASGQPQADDITLLVVRYDGAS